MAKNKRKQRSKNFESVSESSGIRNNIKDQSRLHTNNDENTNIADDKNFQNKNIGKSESSESKNTDNQKPNFKASQSNFKMHLNPENLVKEKYSKKTFDKKSKYAINTFNESSQKAFGDEDKKLSKLEDKVIKRRKQTQKAREKLPQTINIKLEKVADENSNKEKIKPVLVKSEKPIKKDNFAVSKVKSTIRQKAHDKVSEYEDDNVALKSVHDLEKGAEKAAGYFKSVRIISQNKQRKKVIKAEKKLFKAEVDFKYEKYLRDNPHLKDDKKQKQQQKKRIKKEYADSLRKKNAKNNNSKKYAQKATQTTSKIAKKVAEICKNNTTLVLTVALVGVFIMCIMSMFSSCAAMFGDVSGKVIGASYLSEPTELDKTDLYFTEQEMDLQNSIDSIETDYPGYDEYHYNLGEIGHNPFTLINYLSAVKEVFIASEVEAQSLALFNEMYTLTIVPKTETRIRQVQSTDDTGALLYDESGNPIMEDEEYTVTILEVTLTVVPLEEIVENHMTAEQKKAYDVYCSSYGLLQQYGTPIDLHWYNYISSYYGYRKNPNTHLSEFHRGVDIALPVGTKVFSCQDGIITDAAYDSYYGNYVVIENSQGYTTKYAHLDTLNVSSGDSIKIGYLVGTTGNTGTSTGSHLHIECLYNGDYYNPLFYVNVGKGTLYGEQPGQSGDGNPPAAYDTEEVTLLMNEASKYLGYPYKWGGSTPATSFDCSGFVCWVHTNSGVYELPRTNAQGIYNKCQPISASEAKAGDIIFFTGTYNSSNPVTHVGIYCGNGTMIHCGDPIKYSSINTSYWQSHFYSFGRLIK